MLGLIPGTVFSRGSSHISSADPSQPPTIDPKFFANGLDVEVMARHLQTLEKLSSSGALQPFFKAEGLPPAKDLEAAKAFLRDAALTMHHSCGTAAMLPREQGGVVDQELRVYGTKNLRVVDASVFPLIPHANPMTTVYAVAERAADLIRK